MDVGLVSDAVRWTCGPLLLLRIARLPAPASRNALTVSVVVPARDEALTLPDLLGSLHGDTAEVIVVDDSSSDGTADVARAVGATVLAAPTLPAGWTGKTWACATGAAAAAGDVLIFLDADVTLTPGAIDRLALAVSHSGGLVSVQPFHEMRRPYERLSLFFNLIGMMAVDAFGPLRHHVAASGAFGPVLACRRQDYEAVGGHTAVRSAIIEDVALAHRFRASGRDVQVYGGAGSASFRMYPSGLRALSEGWTKNMAAGAGATRVVTLLVVVAWLSACIEAAFHVASTPLVYVAFALQLWWLGRRVGRYGPITALLFPLPLVFFLVVFGRSVIVSRSSRRVRWKGRIVQLER